MKPRHSTIVLTSDTYMELFEEAKDALAEATAVIVPRARKAADGAPVHASLTHDALEA